VGGSLIWLGQDAQGSGIVFRNVNYAPTRISTHALETEIQRYATIADAEAFSYQSEGHDFYVLTFPSAGKTWVYDAVTGSWHRRGTWNDKTNVFDRYRVACHTHAFSGLQQGIHLVGDRESGVVYKMDRAIGTDIGGGVIRRVRRAPHLSGEEYRIAYPNLTIVLETGMGLQSGQGSDPTFMLRWSNNSGQTFGNEHWKSAGRVGQYKTRVKFTRLGAARDRVYEFVVSDPVPWRLIDAVFEPSPSAH
jgi:hypothetical protein